MSADHYTVLGIDNDATSQDIKRAFRQIARACHPDVTGDDPEAEARFKTARAAYETLMDPIARARYDRRSARRPTSGPFFDAFWRASGRQQGVETPRPARGGRTRQRDPGNAVTLDDLFDGFGTTSVRGRAAPPEADGPRRRGPRRGAPAAGADVPLDLDVPMAMAVAGGTVTAVYHRLQRADSWRPGTADPGLVRVQDIADVRVLPGTVDGAVLTERGQGNAGAHGGPYGDLVVRVRLVQAPTEPSAESEDGDREPAVDIGVVEALLGGRVTVETPQGPVKITIPPCTSGGTRMRLRGRGPLGPDGQPTDLFVVTRIVVPDELDAESRKLIATFAMLNP